MGAKALLNSHPKSELGSKGARRCRCCGNQQAIIRKYHLNLCRQCFRERALDIGFIKVSNSSLF
jgi:small subunit ribosomal protein S29e